MNSDDKGPVRVGTDRECHRAALTNPGRAVDRCIEPDLRPRRRSDPQEHERDEESIYSAHDSLPFFRCGDTIADGDKSFRSMAGGRSNLCTLEPRGPGRCV